MHEERDAITLQLPSSTGVHMPSLLLKAVEVNAICSFSSSADV